MVCVGGEQVGEPVEQAGAVRGLAVVVDVGLYLLVFGGTGALCTVFCWGFVSAVGTGGLFEVTAVVPLVLTVLTGDSHMHSRLSVGGLLYSAPVLSENYEYGG